MEESANRGTILFQFGSSIWSTETVNGWGSGDDLELTIESISTSGKPSVSAERFQTEFQWPVHRLDRHPANEHRRSCRRCQFRFDREYATISRLKRLREQARIMRAVWKAE